MKYSTRGAKYVIYQQHEMQICCFMLLVVEGDKLAHSKDFQTRFADAWVPEVVPKAGRPHHH